MPEEKNQYVEACREFLSTKPHVDSSEDGSGYVVNEDDLSDFVTKLFDEQAKQEKEALKAFISKPSDITRHRWAPPTITEGEWMSVLRNRIKQLEGEVIHLQECLNRGGTT